MHVALGKKYFFQRQAYLKRKKEKKSGVQIYILARYNSSTLNKLLYVTFSSYYVEQVSLWNLPTRSSEIHGIIFGTSLPAEIAGRLLVSIALDFLDDLP